MGTWSAAGKNVCITGASSGIGRELALRFAKSGANVALLARRVELLNVLAEECITHGVVAVPLQCDVTDRAACAQAVSEVVQRLAHIDVVILNAGMSQGCYFEDIKDLADADYMLNLNLMGQVNVLHYALPHIPKKKDSRIVAISSVAGVAGVPFRTIYCMTKWGLAGFCNSLRTELVDAYGDDAPKVIISCPPEVDTEINTSRLQFGAAKPAEFMQSVARPVSVAGDSIMQAIQRGARLHLFERMQGIVATLYPIFPTTIDNIVTKTVKKTHIHARAQPQAKL